jgi:hypothetical protein
LRDERGLNGGFTNPCVPDSFSIATLIFYFDRAWSSAEQDTKDAVIGCREGRPAPGGSSFWEQPERRKCLSTIFRILRPLRGPSGSSGAAIDRARDGGIGFSSLALRFRGLKETAGQSLPEWLMNG